jgi:hypothetical protein
MPEDLRRLLEQSRKHRSERLKRKIGFSQELLYRLWNSFNRERDEARDPALRALLFLIGEIADGVTFPYPMRIDGLFSLWRSDPFLFRAFELAVHQLLDALKPPGKIKSPTDLEVADGVWPVLTGPGAPNSVVKLYEDPEALASYVMAGVLQALRGAVPQSPKSDADDTAWEAVFSDYQMDDARRDLSTKQSRGKKS